MNHINVLYWIRFSEEMRGGSEKQKKLIKILRIFTKRWLPLHWFYELISFSILPTNCKTHFYCELYKSHLGIANSQVDYNRIISIYLLIFQIELKKKNNLIQTNAKCS